MKLADPNLTICAECGAHTTGAPEYHPYAFCVLVKAGLNPLTVVLDAAKVLRLAAGPNAGESRNHTGEAR